MLCIPMTFWDGEERGRKKRGFFLKKKKVMKKETISLLPPAGVDNNPLSYQRKSIFI